MSKPRAIAVLERFEEALLVFILAAMLATIVAQVFARYLFNYPLAWTEELARYLFIWLVFVGASQAMRRGDHIAIGLVADALPARVRQVTGVLVNLMVAGFLVVLVLQGWRVVTTVAPLKSVALKVSMAVVYLPLLFGGAAMLVRTIMTTIKIARHGAPEIGARSF